MFCILQVGDDAPPADPEMEALDSIIKEAKASVAAALEEKEKLETEVGPSRARAPFLVPV